MNLTFRHIVNQNLKYNFKRFLSYLFVNGFVVAVLFIYGSLLFNKKLAKDVSMQMVMDYISICTYAIILFSVIFVAYTGIYFVKSRGKEFSVYLTLGMTRRDLIRMIYLESLAIVAGSAVSGIIGGLLLSKLFYLILGRILGLSTTIYFISGKTYLLSLGVFGIVFLCNMLFTSVFIRRLSIIQIGKAGSTKGLSKSRPIIGAIAIIAAAVAMYSYYGASTGADTLFGHTLDDDYRSLIIVGSMLTVFVALYFIIPTCVDVVRTVMRMFPSVYNRHLLMMTNLKHRFFAYKVSLYMVTLLISFAIITMGFGLSFYSYTQKTINQNLPYDFMIESGAGINNVSADEVNQIVKKNGGEASGFSQLSYLYDENYREDRSRFTHSYAASMVVSESNFNRHTGLSVDVKPDEMVIANSQADMDSNVDFDTVMTVEPWRKGDERAVAFERNPVSKEKFLQSLGNTPSLSFTKEKTRAIVSHFINSYGDVEFEGVLANVVDDSVYAELKAKSQAPEYTSYLFNLKKGSGENVYAGILDALRATNHADSLLWSSADTMFGNKDQAEALRPIYKKERFDIAFKINGLLFFSLSFLGILFLLSSSVVLYYKMVTDIDEEKEQVALLKKIGLTVAECKSYLQTHLAVVFFAPLLLGGLFGIFFLSSAWAGAGANMSGFLMGRVGLMYGVFALLDVLFYMALRKKFFRGVRI